MYNIEESKLRDMFVFFPMRLFEHESTRYAIEFAQQCKFEPMFASVTHMNMKCAALKILTMNSLWKTLDLWRNKIA